MYKTLTLRGAWLSIRVRVPLAFHYCRNGEIEARTRAGLGFDPDMTPVALDNPLADSQPYACAWLAGASPCPSKHGEYAVGILPVDADTVVLHAELPPLPLPAGADAHHRGSFGTILDGVGQQVLKQLYQLPSSATITGSGSRVIRAAESSTAVFRFSRALRQAAPASTGAAAWRLLSTLDSSRRSRTSACIRTVASTRKSINSEAS